MKRLTLIALAAASLASAPVWASSASGTATLTNFTVQLFDLDPLDAFAPTITFNASGSYDTYVYASAYTTNPYEYDYQDQQSGVPFDPMSVTATTSLVTATAAVSGTGIFTGMTLSASGSSTGPVSGNPYDYSQHHAQAYSPYYYYAGVTLSPKTLAVFSADATVAASADTAGSTYGYAYSNAQSYLYLTGPASGGGSGSQSSQDYRTATVNPSGGMVSANDSGPIGVSFLNLTGADMNGQMQAYAYAYGYAYAVPEPGTYALMLAGLAAVGSLVRRRAKR